MEFKTAVFYFLATILVLAALRVVTARNPVHAVLYLVLAFFSAGGVWMLLAAEFLAITLVMVYVGAVMVLFLFVVMMLDIDLARLREGFWTYLPAGALVGALLAFEMILVLGGTKFSFEAFPVQAPAADYSNTRALGLVLYTEYVYPFELASLVLLVAMIGAVSLTLRKRRASKYVAPPAQLAAHREGRVELVKMAAERDMPAKDMPAPEEPAPASAGQPAPPAGVATKN
jgi:NADH-quinone oxidoreductase subunit J